MEESFLPKNILKPSQESQRNPQIQGNISHVSFQQANI
jgi:hypothetical protein